MSTVHLVVGLPGAGKTTMARGLCAQFAAVRLCPDEWMPAAGIGLHDSAARDTIEAAQLAVARAQAAAGRDVVIEWGTWTRQERDGIRERLQRDGHRVFGYFLEPDLEQLTARLAVRELDRPDVDRVTGAELAEGWKQYQPLTSDEAALFQHTIQLH